MLNLMFLVETCQFCNRIRFLIARIGFNLIPPNQEKSISSESVAVHSMVHMVKRESVLVDFTRAPPISEVWASYACGALAQPVMSSGTRSGWIPKICCQCPAIYHIQLHICVSQEFPSSALADLTGEEFEDQLVL